MYGRSGDGRLGGDERDGWGNIMTHLKRRMVTRGKPPVTTRPNVIEKHVNSREMARNKREETRNNSVGDG